MNQLAAPQFSRVRDGGVHTFLPCVLLLQAGKAKGATVLSAASTHMRWH